MKSIPSIVCSFLVACAPAGKPAASEALAADTPRIAVPVASETLSADTPRTTIDGSSFVAPTGWSIRTAGPAVILTAPEGGSHVALVDVAAKDADAAVAAAWAAYDAQARWPLKSASARPVRDGWEEI